MAEKGAGAAVIKSSKRPKSEAKYEKYENDSEYKNMEKNKEPAQSKPDNAEYADIPAQTGVYQTLDTTAKTMETFEVENQNESFQKTQDRFVKEAERFCRYHQLCCCFGTLCVILVLCVIGVCVYFRVSNARELNQLKSSQQVLLEENQNLTNLNNKLSSDYKNLMIQFDNLTTFSITLENNITTLTVENYNLTAVSMALKNNITTLTTENHNLTSLNEELKEQRKNLTGIIKNMEETWNELNVSRAQWSIDQYCPKNSSGVRNCTSCQNGWNYQLSSCYAYNNPPPAYQINWYGARENCKTKNSDLTVVSNNAEKDYVKTQSPLDTGINGYWIGLRAEGGKWKWLDGSDLTDQAWIQQQPVDGQCVTSLQNREWTSVSCTERNAWICEKKALSV